VNGRSLSEREKHGLPRRSIIVEWRAARADDLGGRLLQTQARNARLWL